MSNQAAYFCWALSVPGESKLHDKGRSEHRMKKPLLTQSVEAIMERLLLLFLSGNHRLIDYCFSFI